VAAGAPDDYAWRDLVLFLEGLDVVAVVFGELPGGGSEHIGNRRRHVGSREIGRLPEFDLGRRDVDPHIRPQPVLHLVDQKAADMIVYAPRKIVLAPHEPQAIRIRAIPPAGLADGEYRVHLLFRAIPPATPVVQAAAAQDQEKGLRFQLTPVYGVTIPVIVRLGNLQASAQIENVRLERKGDKSLIDLDIARSGQRSTFGEVRVFKAGVKAPVALQKAIAVYTEIGVRHVSVPIADDYKGDISGPVTVQYVETFDDGSHVLAETQAMLR
jgi:hypothetical protein